MADGISTQPEKSDLRDHYGRTIRYLRLAVTSRCNLHCIYCRPSHHPIPTTADPPAEVLVRLVRIMSGLGIRKVRLTGGEPLVRKDLVSLLHRMRASAPGTRFHLTTNGVALAQAAPALAEAGIAGVNVSLDAANPEAFCRITGRAAFERVQQGIRAAVSHGIPLKINCVVLKHNLSELEGVAELARQWPVPVRFIEAMPFNGLSSAGPRIPLQAVADRLVQQWEAIPEPATEGTAQLYRMPRGQGRIGFIYAYSRTFCHQCDRIRVTPEGRLQLCLYQEPAVDLFRLMAEEPDDVAVAEAIRRTVLGKPKDGHADRREEHNRIYPSMAQIGG